MGSDLFHHTNARVLFELEQKRQFFAWGSVWNSVKEALRRNLREN